MKCAYCRTERREDSRGLCRECGAPRTTEHEPSKNDWVWIAAGGCCGLLTSMAIWKYRPSKIDIERHAG